MKVSIIAGGAYSAEVPDGTNLVVLTRVRKFPRPHLKFKCGTCRRHIGAGRGNLDAVKPKERKHLTDGEPAAGWRMACQTFARGDVTVSWTAAP